VRVKSRLLLVNHVGWCGIARHMVQYRRITASSASQRKLSGVEITTHAHVFQLNKAAAAELVI
jgi:hypothetical protein